MLGRDADGALAAHGMELDEGGAGAKKKKKSRGAKLSKAEREARRELRLNAAAADSAGGAALEERRARLLAHVAAGEWDESLSLAVESAPLANALVRALVPLGRHRQLAHAGRRLVQTLPLDALTPLVAEALDTGNAAAAASLARGLGVAAAFGPRLVDGALRAFEDGRVAEGAEAIGSEPCTQLAALRAMLQTSRCLNFAAQYLTALRALPRPTEHALAALGAEAGALLAGADAA